VLSSSRTWASGVPNKTTVASDQARLFLARGGRSSATAVASLRERTSQVLQTGVAPPAAPVSREPAPEDPQQEARRLNEHGALLRREGNYELAAEQHRAALAIVRDLGDRQAEALTLNNLALALAHTGVPTALQHFEQSLVVLRELGDEEHEGQVIANLGFVHRRQGRSEEADTLLHEALDKLPPGPESDAMKAAVDALFAKVVEVVSTEYADYATFRTALEPLPQKARKMTGPRADNGQVIGGEMLLATSVELEFAITSKFAQAVFFDAGNAFDGLGAGVMEQGAGGGLRWKSPVGPVRLDLAFALNHDDWRIHFTMGPDL